MDLYFCQTRFILEETAKAFTRAVLTPNFLAKSVKAHGPIPGVTRVELVGGEKIAIGVVRKVFLTNGGELNEQVTALEQAGTSYRMAYEQLTAFPFPFSLISKAARGEYLAEPRSNGTLFTWKAWHTLTSPIVIPAALATRVLYAHPMMQEYLKTIEETAEPSEQ